MRRWIGAAALGLLLGAGSAAQACQGTGAPTLVEDFKNPDIGWGKPDTIASYSPQGLVMRPPVGGSAWRWNRNFNMARADFCIEAVNPSPLPNPANAETVGDAGMWFWGTDAQNFFSATISLDGTAAVDRLVNGIWQPVVAPRPTPAVRTAAGATNEIELVTSGNAATFFVNGSRIADFHGQPPQGGGAPGIYAESGPQITTWLFPRAVLYGGEP
jgi:hypothetical protein